VPKGQYRPNGLAMLVQGVLHQDPFTGHLFVFRGRTRANLIKIIYWDGTGFYKTDLAKAKALLAEAGVPDGFETTISTHSSMPPSPAWHFAWWCRHGPCFSMAVIWNSTLESSNGAAFCQPKVPGPRVKQAASAARSARGLPVTWIRDKAHARASAHRLWRMTARAYQDRKHGPVSRHRGR